jgi:hypothetical protein
LYGDRYKEIYKLKIKNIMKKLLLSFAIILLINALVMGQGFPVYDNTNFLTLGKQIIESTKQTAELLKTAEFLREQKESIEQVSEVVKQLKAVQEISLNNERLFKIVRNDLREILSSPFIKPDEVERVSESFNDIIDNALEDFDFITEVLSSDHLKMTDAERSKVLKERERQSKEMVAEIERKTKLYRDIISFREMQYKINNRELNY